jgi:hypothetical protein
MKDDRINLPTSRALKAMSKIMAKKLAAKGMTGTLIARSPEEKAAKRRLWKLKKIRQLEHEFTGEADW